MASPPPTATKRALAEERLKLDQLRTYYKRIVKERNDLKEKLEKAETAAPGTPVPRPARESRIPPRRGSAASTRPPRGVGATAS